MRPSGRVSAILENELGIEVESLDIRSNGDITVEFGEGYTDEGGALALSICERRIASVLEPGEVPVLGPAPNLGRPGTDADVEALLSERADLGFEGADIAEFAGERRVSIGFGAAASDSARTPASSSWTRMSPFARASLAEFFADVPSVWAMSPSIKSSHTARASGSTTTPKVTSNRWTAPRRCRTCASGHRARSAIGELGGANATSASSIGIPRPLRST